MLSSLANAVIQTLSENISVDQLDLVWFAHELGYKKCTIWGQPMGNRYAEVTYNRDKDEMYGIRCDKLY